MINILPIILLAIQSLTVPRLAVCHDGNFHDHDDIGASAMDLGLISRTLELYPGRFKLVYFGHSEHMAANDNLQHTNMIISAIGNIGGFGIDLSVIFDGYLEHHAAARHLARTIAGSNAQDILTIIQGGPWEKMAQAFDAAPPHLHQYVHIISHSDWNNNHQHISAHRTKNEFFAQYASGGVYQAYLPPTYTRIDDQNSYAFRSNMTGDNSWKWLPNSPNTLFIHNRTLAAGGSAIGDMSDSGMLFYWLTGIEHPTMNHIRAFFNL